jgi:hypothetical protein
MVETVINSILEQYQINPVEWKKLANIGGHKLYHLEGNALEHSLLVYYAACEMFRGNVFSIEWHMQRVALLHDIGKIYTSIERAEGDWEYPDHSVCGSFKGILCKFIDINDPHFIDYQWLIRNHIKPLFWRKNGTNLDTNPWEKDKLDPKLANIDNLRKLAICDLMGSKPVDGKAHLELIEYLKDTTRCLV